MTSCQNLVQSSERAKSHLQADKSSHSLQGIEWINNFLQYNPTTELQNVSLEWGHLGLYTECGGQTVKSDCYLWRLENISTLETSGTKQWRCPLFLQLHIRHSQQDMKGDPISVNRFCPTFNAMTNYSGMQKSRRNAWLKIQSRPHLAAVPSLLKACRAKCNLHLKCHTQRKNESFQKAHRGRLLSVLARKSTRVTREEHITNWPAYQVLPPFHVRKDCHKKTMQVLRALGCILTVHILRNWYGKQFQNSITWFCDPCNSRLWSRAKQYRSDTKCLRKEKSTQDQLLFSPSHTVFEYLCSQCKQPHPPTKDRAHLLKATVLSLSVKSV